MLIVNLEIFFELPFVFSLKGRRKIVHSIKDRLSKQNLSILDISSEYPKEATLAVVFLALDQQSVDKKLKKIDEILQRHFSEIDFEFSYEII